LSLWRLLFKQPPYFGFSYYVMYLVCSDVSEGRTASSFRVSELGSGGSIHMTQNPVGKKLTQLYGASIIWIWQKFVRSVILRLTVTFYSSSSVSGPLTCGAAVLLYRPSWEQLHSNKGTPCNPNSQHVTNSDKLRRLSVIVPAVVSIGVAAVAEFLCDTAAICTAR
jgi:hypothetical protein